jgi:hypothetical protein
MIIALADCGTSDSKSKPPPAPTGTAPAAAGPVTCDGYTKGSGGVINVFCGGSAKADGTIGQTPFELHGGSCVHNITFMSVNVGVLVGPDFAGDLPDYFGIVLKPQPGPFDSASATIDAVGDPHALTLSGTLDKDMQGGKFAGVDGSTKVSGSFSC